MQNLEPIESYFPIVWKIARSFPETALFEHRDYFQIGAIGLIQAYRTFNKYLDFKFSTHAAPRIRGAIRDELRRAYSYGRVRDWKPSKWKTPIAPVKHAVSLDRLKEDLDFEPSYVDRGFDWIEHNELVSKFLKLLANNERFVMSWYYWEGLTMKEIGKMMGQTESRVSQINTKGLERLKRHIKRTEEVT